MPQAAIAALGSFLVGAIAASGYTLVVKAFLYIAASYLLQRASEALTPRRRSQGLGGGNVSNYYDAGALQ